MILTKSLKRFKEADYRQLKTGGQQAWPEALIPALLFKKVWIFKIKYRIFRQVKFF